MMVFDGLVPVFALVAIGFGIRRLGWLTPEVAAGTARVVANVALPALLLAKVGTADLGEALSWPAIGVTAAVTVAATLLAAVAAGAAGLPGAQRGVVAQAAMRGNIAYVAFPLILGAYGDGAFRIAAVTGAVLIPLMNVLAVAALENGRGGGRGFWRRGVGVAVNPMVAATVGALLLAALDWHPWRWLAVSLETLGGFALPGALLAIGAQIDVRAGRRVWRLAAATAVAKLVVVPLAGFVWLRLAGATAVEVTVGTLLLAVPTAVVSFPVAADLDGDVDLAAACVVVSTVASLATLALWGVVFTPA